MGVGTCHGHLDTQDSPRPGLGSKPPPYSLIVYSVTLRGTCARMSLFPGTPKVGVPKLSQIQVLRLWDFIAPRPDLRSGRGLNQSCNPPRELSNTMLHSRSARREQVDSRLLVVGSQTASLTPGPSFAHNMGCRCLNDQYEAIFDIYVSRPFR